MKDNHLNAIKWIDKMLENSTKQIQIGCETYHDLNYSLEINRNRILMQNGSSYSAYKQTKKIKAQIGGIGLANLKKRLELNYGPDFYSLDIIKEKNKYIAHLKVTL